MRLGGRAPRRCPSTAETLLKAIVENGLGDMLLDGSGRGGVVVVLGRLSMAVRPTLCWFPHLLSLGNRGTGGEYASEDGHLHDAGESAASVHGLLPPLRVWGLHWEARPPLSASNQRTPVGQRVTSTKNAHLSPISRIMSPQGPWRSAQAVVRHPRSPEIQASRPRNGRPGVSAYSRVFRAPWPYTASSSLGASPRSRAAERSNAIGP